VRAKGSGPAERFASNRTRTRVSRREGSVSPIDCSSAMAPFRGFHFSRSGVVASCCSSVSPTATASAATVSAKTVAIRSRTARARSGSAGLADMECGGNSR